MADTATMTTYVVECTCGHNLKVNAGDKESAITQLKGMMDQRGIDEHFKKHHQGEPKPTLPEVHAHIANDIKEM